MGRRLAAVVTILFAVVWVPLLSRSLWWDEAGTYWMAHEGLIRAVQKTMHWPGQSLLYAAIASVFCFDGTPARDLLLRIPSLLGIFGATYFLYRIAEERIGNHAGMVAAILFLFHPDVTMVGFQARPYTLAMAAATASCWALGQWEKSRSRIYLLYYACAVTLVLYLHYFFAAILAAHALYLAYMFFVDGRRERMFELIGAGAAALLLALPLVPHIRLLMSEGHTLPFGSPPSLQALTDLLAPSLLIAGLLIAGCVLSWAGPATDCETKPPGRAFLVLLITWWLVGPVLFWAASRATPMRIFVPRYLAYTYPAQALLLTWLGCALFGAARARIWALAGVLIFAANPVMAIHARKGPDELLPLIRLIRAEPHAPLFFPSLLPESQAYDWRSGNQPGSYLFAPLVAYPIENPLIPLPRYPTSEIKDYVGEVVDKRLAGSPEMLFVDKDGDWEQWIVDRMRRAGYHAEIRPAGNFSLLVFKRCGAGC
jgi:mannosyltransferase